MTDMVDCVVVGAGVVGLAVARALALRGREVMVLEAADAMGTGISSRNSEVIHAELYYPTGSLKARMCVRGEERLYARGAERGVPYRRCGKLLVATSAAQLASVESIQACAPANSVLDQQWLSRSEALALDPARGDAFDAEVRKYWPDLRDDALPPDTQASAPRSMVHASLLPIF